MKTENEKILYSLIATVLNVPISSIDDNTSPDSIESWDSLTHLKLVMAIESEYKINLSPEDTMDMLSVKLIKIILEQYL